MKLFGKNNKLIELEDQLEEIKYDYGDIERDIKILYSEIKKLNLISNIFPNESLHPMKADYKKDKERLEKEGYTMQGCIDNQEIWVNKGVKNG